MDDVLQWLQEVSYVWDGSHDIEPFANLSVGKCGVCSMGLC